MIVSKLASVSKACSGSVINTSKKNLIITAAHCFAKREGKSWVLIPERLDAVLNKQVSFRPSYDGTKSINDPQRFPFGIRYSKNVYILPSSSKSSVDVAILEVNPDENGREIQGVIGGGMTSTRLWRKMRPSRQVWWVILYQHLLTRNRSLSA